MRILWVNAGAFGALLDQTMSLGPGLNVVAGPNGSGKSTWHAAMYAALGGYPAEEHRRDSDARFARYRQPRHVGRWEVRAAVELASGRRLRVHQDLLNPHACRVTPGAGGPDEGGLDGMRQPGHGGGLDLTRWLGLDRRSYAATAWVEQARTRTALVSRDGRNELQLAVATCLGSDEAESAIERIDELRRQYVGDAGTGPLGRATAAAQRRASELAKAGELDVQRDRAAERVTRARARVNHELARLAAVEAVAARAEADRLRAEVDQLRAALVSQPVRTPRPAWSGLAGTVAPVPEPAEDAQVHPTVRAAEDELREIDEAVARARPAEPAARPRRPAVAPVARPLGWGACVAGIAFLMFGIAIAILVSLFFGAVLAAGGIAITVVGVLLLTQPPAVAPPEPGAHRRAPAPSPVTGSDLAELERRRREALAHLAEALAARGHRAEAATAREALADYRFACERRRGAEPPPPEPGTSGVTLRQVQADQADLRARDLEEQADPYVMRQIRYEYPDGVDLEAARRSAERAQEDLEAERAALAAAEHAVASLGLMPRADAAARAAQAAVDELRRLDRVLQRAGQELVGARKTALRDIAVGITPRLGDYLADVTAAAVTESDLRDLEERIGASLLRRDHELGSHSTAELVYLFTRIELGRHLAPDRELGPLLLDDVTSGLDSRRLPRLLGVLHRMASHRQVVLFAQQDDVAAWARDAMRGDPDVRLHVLTSVHEPPSTEPPSTEPPSTEPPSEPPSTEPPSEPLNAEPHSGPSGAEPPGAQPAGEVVARTSAWGTGPGEAGIVPSRPAW